MIDQEKRAKVIRALENCNARIKCKDCPWEPCEEFGYKHSDYPDDLIQQALALLKAQEPVKPTIGGDEWDSSIGSRWYKCGACEYPIDKGDRYCRHCGRPVKWE